MGKTALFLLFLEGISAVVLERDEKSGHRFFARIPL
jgi:hypothetical protein